MSGVSVIHSYHESPIGTILLVGHDDGQSQRLTGLYTAEHVRPPAITGDRDDEAFARVREQLSEYFAGERTSFDVELAAAGTPFQRLVWDELARIEYGDVATYAQIADRVGAPKAVRAVGMANGRNLISIIVPCHRVIGSDGKLTGYAGGVAAKQWLLTHEASRRAVLVRS